MSESKTRIRVAVLLRKGGQVLLVRHQKPHSTYWLLPGGGLEYCESIEQCARREMMEELGLQIQLGDLVYVSESIPPDRHRHVLNLYYEGAITGGELRLGDEEVLAGAEFFPIDRLEEIDLRPPIARELTAYLKDPARRGRISLGNRWD